MSDERPRRARKAKPRLPLVAVASFAENILEEKGLHSLVRLYDTLNFTTPPNLPDTTELPLKMFIMLRSNYSETISGEVDMIHRLPDGSTRGSVAGIVAIDGEGKNFTITINLSVPLISEGLHWFDIRWAEQVLTRVPLRLNSRQESSGSVQTMSGEDLPSSVVETDSG
jgi:hypothetical protein